MNRRVAFKMVRTDVGPGEKGLPSSPLEAPKPEKDSSPGSEQFEPLKARLVQEAWVCTPNTNFRHNSRIPHSAFQGQTPDEVYFGAGEGVPDHLATARANARHNRARRCLVCA